jgi:DNA invertase Pin-like site-specific DNA recombinase
MSKKETLHIYRRVSTGEQSKKYSLGNQLEYGIKKSKKLEMDYQDWNEEGKSGSSEKIEDRIVLTRMYSQLQMGKIKHLFVYDLSRLSRNPMVSSLLRKEMEDNGVKLYTNESDVDFQKNEQVLMYDFISSISQFFVKVQREKSMVGKVSHFKKGGWRGGTFPFGYVSEKVDGVKRLVINPDESKWVRKIYDWYDNDISTKEIGMSLDKNGVKPRRGKFWSFGSIQVILKNRLYIGKDEMIDNITNPQKPITLYHTNPDIQIIDNETFSRVRIKVKNQQRIKNINTKVIHTDVLLRGKLFCESCGEIYGCRVKPKKNEYYYYCRSRENNWRKIDESKKVKCSVKKSINIKNIDKQVWNTIVELLGNSHIIKETLKENELINKKKDDEQRKDRLLELRKGKRYVEKMVNQLDSREKDNRNWFLSGEIDKKQYDDGMKVISDTREERFSELEQVSLDIQGVLDENKWIDWLEKHGSWIGRLKDGYTIDEKKEIISEYVSRILVSFDTSINQHRLKIHLKLPIVDDGYEVLTGGKNREYIIKNGKSYTDTLVDKVKSGRKKKDENVVICGDTQIPPINLTPSPLSNSRF